MNDKYIPINCEFLDRIEHWYIRKELCQIIYRQGSFPRDIETEGIIKDIFTKEKAEYLLLDDETEIRLDKIVSINGYELPKNSCRIG